MKASSKLGAGRTPPPDSVANYRDYEAGANYEQVRFASPMGSYRYRRERRALSDLVATIRPGSTVLDCPSGTGRWWELLQTRADRIIAADASPGMLRHCRERAEATGRDIEVVEADALALPFSEDSVDWVFSYALTKHLPPSRQAAVLAEFGRVARFGVICSFPVAGGLTYELWRRRPGPRPYVVLPEQLEWAATAAGLQVDRRARCTTPLGVEFAYLFSAA